MKALQQVYEAAKQEKAMAEDKAYGKKVEANSDMKNSLAENAPVVVPGKFVNQSQRVLGNKESQVLTSMAKTLGLNVVMSDSLAPGVNGSYDYENRTIVLNANNTMGENLNAIFSHEVTHHLSAYAGEEFKQLSRYVMDAFYKSDADAFNAAIKEIQDRYKKEAKQELRSEERRVGKEC